MEQIPALVTSFPEESQEKTLVIANPSQQPVVYYYSTEVEGNYPEVYNSTGTDIPVTSRVLTDQKVEVTLPEGTPKGLCLIQTPRKFVRWIYY